MPCNSQGQYPTPGSQHFFIWISANACWLNPWTHGGLQPIVFSTTRVSFLVIILDHAAYTLKCNWGFSITCKIECKPFKSVYSGLPQIIPVSFSKVISSHHPSQSLFSIGSCHITFPLISQDSNVHSHFYGFLHLEKSCSFSSFSSNITPSEAFPYLPYTSTKRIINLPSYPHLPNSPFTFLTQYYIAIFWLFTYSFRHRRVLSITYVPRSLLVPWNSIIRTLGK